MRTYFFCWNKNLRKIVFHASLKLGWISYCVSGNFLIFIQTKEGNLCGKEKSPESFPIKHNTIVIIPPHLSLFLCYFSSLSRGHWMLSSNHYLSLITHDDVESFHMSKFDELFTSTISRFSFISLQSDDHKLSTGGWLQFLVIWSINCRVMCCQHL